MKIYISADIEGVAGIAAWEEARSKSPTYPYFAKQMTREVKGACIGANKARAKKILIKDPHGLARNIDPSKLPKNTRVIRGWSGHPYKMLHGIDKDFDGIIFIATLATNEGRGNSTISIYPDKSIRLIEEGVERALKNNLNKNQVKLASSFKLEIGYKDHGYAYRKSFYPGARQVSPRSIRFETRDYYEIMRATSFLI